MLVLLFKLLFKFINKLKMLIKTNKIINNNLKEIKKLQIYKTWLFTNKLLLKFKNCKQNKEKKIILKIVSNLLLFSLNFVRKKVLEVFNWILAKILFNISA